MSAVRIYMAGDCSLLSFRKSQANQIRWVLYSLTFHMLARISNYAIDARIAGLCKPIHVELNQTNLQTWRHSHAYIVNYLSGAEM
jgi:hypothetical protein